MTVDEITAARKAWESKRTGTSPMAGNKPWNLVGKGIIRDIIGAFDNGIQVVGYRDRQNRNAGTNYDTPQ